LPVLPCLIHRLTRQIVIWFENFFLTMSEDLTLRLKKFLILTRMLTVFNLLKIREFCYLDKRNWKLGKLRMDPL
jgi:hypothetical protein